MQQTRCHVYLRSAMIAQTVVLFVKITFRLCTLQTCQICKLSLFLTWNLKQARMPHSKLLVEIQSGKWLHEQQLKAYSGIRKELSVFEGVILKRNRIVVPQLLRKQILKIVHEVHQGILKTKQFLRARFFWPAWIKLLKLWLKVAVLVFWTSRWINTHHFSRCLYLVVHGSKEQWFSWDLLMVSTYWHTLTTTLPIQKHTSWKR